MTNEKSSALHKRLSKKPTQWLRDLPPGIYTIKQLEDITGKVSSTIKQRLNLLEVPRSYNPSSGFPLVMYDWKGIVEYEIENLEKKSEPCKEG